MAWQSNKQLFFKFAFSFLVFECLTIAAVAAEPESTFIFNCSFDKSISRSELTSEYKSNYFKNLPNLQSVGNDLDIFLELSKFNGPSAQKDAIKQAERGNVLGDERLSSVVWANGVKGEQSLDFSFEKSTLYKSQRLRLSELPSSSQEPARNSFRFHAQYERQYEDEATEPRLQLGMCVGIATSTSDAHKIWQQIQLSMLRGK